MSREGIRLDRFYAAAPVCSPTRASVMTGRHPNRMGVFKWGYPMRPQETTIAEALREHGYRTGHIGKWHLGEDPHGPLQQGFDIQIPRWNKGWPKAGYHAPFQFDGLEDERGDYLTDRLTDEAETFIEANRDQPFFLYLSFTLPHYPHPMDSLKEGDPLMTPAVIHLANKTMRVIRQNFLTSIGVNSLGMLPILIAGSEEQKTEYGNRMADGDLCAYCVTEPEAGDDEGADPANGR